MTKGEFITQTVLPGYGQTSKYHIICQSIVKHYFKQQIKK